MTLIELIVETSEQGLPLFIESGPMSGGTSPATLASTVVLANAELLSSFVLAKAVNPAVPLIYASWARILDMRAATVSHGGPEFPLLRMATTQMAKYYGLPSGGGGILADTKSIDVQLGMEKLGTGLLPALADTNMVVGMGLFADENAISLETLVIDHEICGWIKRVMRGIEVTDETTDLSVFEAVGPGGDFVGTGFTLEHFRKEMFIPKIMDRGFLSLGKRSDRQRHAETCKKTLCGGDGPLHTSKTAGGHRDKIGCDHERIREEGPGMGPNQTIDEIIDAIIRLNGNQVTELTLKAVAEGVAPLTVINEGLAAGLRKVGDLFADEQIFLPELIKPPV